MIIQTPFKCRPLAIALSLLAGVCGVSAHVGVVNSQLSYAREGSYELFLAVPHGCSYTPAGGVETDLDVYRLEVTTPVAFTRPRPIVDGVFGIPTLSAQSDGTTTFVWTKPASLDTPAFADTMSYRVGIRGSFESTSPTKAGARFTTQRFNTKQFCKHPTPGQPDIVIDWSNYGTPASNQSPTVRVFPTRQPGWNSYTLPADVAAGLSSPAAVSAFVRSFFADAQIVWLDKAGYSPNTVAMAKIQALIQRDNTYSELLNRASISSNETLWVKY